MTYGGSQAYHPNRPRRDSSHRVPRRHRRRTRPRGARNRPRRQRSAAGFDRSHGRRDAAPGRPVRSPGDAITDPQTPYPTTITGTGRTFSTAHIVLNDPSSSSPGDILTYCIDLTTETEIGVHYELGDWSSANVPNLDYVTYILNNYYPVVFGGAGAVDGCREGSSRAGCDLVLHRSVRRAAIRLPDTGVSAPPSWGMPAALLTAGLAVILLGHVRRRSRASR